MKQLILFTALLLLITGCKKKEEVECTSTNDQTYVNDIELTPSSDTFANVDNDKSHFIRFQLSAISKMVEGKRCKAQTQGPVNLGLKTYYYEWYTGADISLYCNRSLVIDEDSIPKGNNLLNIKGFATEQLKDALEPFSMGMAFITIDSTNFPKGSYIFYASGTTNLGNNFIDSITIKRL